MWEVDKAVEESASYEQVGRHRWRAGLTGMITASAEADTPSRSLTNLKLAIDQMLSSIVRRVGPFAAEEDGARAFLAPQWEKLLTAEIARVAVSDKPKKPAAQVRRKVAKKVR